MPSNVLPEPGPPETRVGRPVGRPPLVISSKPGIPVGDFLRAGGVSVASVIGPAFGVSAMARGRLESIRLREISSSDDLASLDSKGHYSSVIS